MSKKDTAESKKILKLLGKPTTTTRITKNNNPAIQKLIHYFEGDMPQVYRWYDTLKSLGWVAGDYMEFLKSVKANKKKLETPDGAIDYPKGEEFNELAYQAAAAIDEGMLVTMRRELNAARTQLKNMQAADYEKRRLIESLREELDSARPDKFTVNVQKVKPRAKGHYYNILPISDVHYGETVKPQDVNNLNEYNFKISKQRHIELFRQNHEFAQSFGCEELDIFMLGDIFSGNIHDELRENNEAPITKCIVDYYKFITGLIDAYKGFYKKVRIHCVVGNHARTTQKYQFKNKGVENYEYILYAFIEDKYNSTSDNVTVSLGESTILFATVGEQVWKLEHGDRYKGGSAFVSPLSTTVRDNFKDQGMFESTGQKFDAVMMGHWHIGGEWYLPGTTTPVYMNPSLIGPGEFAVHNCHSAFPASSYSFITDGHEVVDKRLINLSKVR